MDKPRPKLRTVNKAIAPYRLNVFPSEFAFKLGKEIVYLLASKGQPTIEGDEWETVFAECIGAQWRPSNVGLDDVVLGNTAWGAKTVKADKPSVQKKIRLISGRNSPVYSFGGAIDVNSDPNKLGESVLDIWNERVSAVREKFQNLRTVILIRSKDLTELVIFEVETIRYDIDLFYWEWNKNGNLIGYEKSTSEHRFTWQPHGSQFTIVTNVPKDRLIITIQKPEHIDKNAVLNAIGFDKSWVTIVPAT